MIIHSILQGSPEWLALRCEHFCASEAAAMMGVSSHMTRTELLRQKATGIVPDVDSFAQKRFDNGHAAESEFRLILERIIEADLYPITGSIVFGAMPLLASFDGLTMDNQTGYEHKQINNDFRALRRLETPMVPDQYVWQIEQQLLVSGARGIWFCASDGTEADCLRIFYKSDPARREKLIAGWKQFAIDLANWQPEPAVGPSAVGRTPDNLPALRIEVTGMVTSSNLNDYKTHALAVFKSVNRELTTDQHFADVPEIAWGFHIGGYQPAQKWLKDRRGRVLSWDDLGHYQKIVKILAETDRIMKQIELPLAPDS